MGRKKRNLTPRSEQSPLAAAGGPVTESAIGGASLSGPELNINSNDGLQTKNEFSPQSEGPDHSTIKIECERALAALRRGNHTEAVGLMKESCAKHDDSSDLALAHRVLATVCVKVASIIDDPTAKQQHLKNAIESARKAVDLSPNSVEFAYFYANLLYDAANDRKEYEEVVLECERAQLIKNPIDPAKESLPDESEQKISTAEARIGHVQNELQQLWKKSKLALTSSWVNNVGVDKENFQFAPDKNAKEDPMEAGVAQSRRPNEIKKATKTPEERRKEIEVQVAAARLLQQQSESPQTQNEGDRDNRALDSSSGAGQRIGARRKHGIMRKIGSTTDQSDRVRSYWNIMSIDMKKDLLRLRVCDLKSHFVSPKDTSVNDVLSEALSFAEINKTWKFWLCCRCNEKYSDPESHIQHVVQQHIGNLLPKMQRLLPQNVDNRWIDMILNYSWKPLDVSAAVKLLENQTKCKDSTFSDNSYPGRDNLGHSLQAFRAESSDHIKIAETDIPLADGWPISHDSKRAILLEIIHSLFKMLIRHKYLASSHINAVIQFAINEINGLAAGSHLLSHCVDLSPICICFLEAPQLKKLLNFLQQLSYACDLGRNADKCPMGDLHNASEGPEIKEKIVLNEDATCLLLDECLLPTEVTDDMTTLTSPDGFLHSNHPFLSWIYSCSSSGDQLTSWLGYKEDKRHRGVEIVQMLEDESYHLQNLCEKKCEGMSYVEALQKIQHFLLEEGKKSQYVTEFAPPGYESLLRKRIEELRECAMDLMFIGNRFELQALSYVLKGAEAKALNANQSGYDEETYGGATSQLHDLESVEVNCKMKDDYSETERTLILGQTSQMDSYIEITMQKLRDNLSLERGEIDARIMRNLTKMKQLELRLEPVSAHDYRAILLPLVKLYLRAYLEDLAEKDAREKSDAAREAFLAELALESKKVVKGGNDNTRHTEKTKDKKKKKGHRKTRDLKAIGGQEQLESPFSETLSCDQVGRDSNDQDSEINVSVGGDDLEQQEEESTWQLEREEHEKMLEKALDLLRRVENEGKQKHLADQREKLSGAYLEEVADKLQDAQLRTVAGGPDTHGRARPQVMENDLHLLDQRTVKEGIGHKSSSTPVVDGKIEAATLEKENIEGARVDCQNSSSKGFVSGANGTKTLKELPVEDDEEQTFQADLKVASQSLDTYEAHAKLPSVSSLSSPERTSPQVDNWGVTGLKNEAGEYNCFLNVIIQSLWHLSPFREEFLRRSRSEHNHVGNPCVVCALYEIFTAMYVASKDSARGEVAPTSLRKALSNLHPDSNFFQEAQMNDASEVLAAIFDWLHKSYASGSSVSDSESVEGNDINGSWDCDNPCIVHSLFGMDIFQRMNCYHCGLDSRHLKYTALFHDINASALRDMKTMHGESSFDELLNLVQMNHQLACDPEAGGCGTLNYFDHILSTPPHVFITVLGWQNTCESADDIRATLAALNTEIDISVLYRGLDPERTHRLVSVVCYCRQHYRCFAYSHDHGQWLICDDTTVEFVGGWADVLTICDRELLQPQILFFEAVN